jgi:hypothetical protein
MPAPAPPSASSGVELPRYLTCPYSRSLKFASDGTRTTFATGGTGAAINGDLAVDAAGNLFACANGTIFKFTPDGTKSAFLKNRPEPGAAEEEAEDSSVGLPDKYAKDYLISASTISPDKKFAIIYPTRDDEEFPEGKNYVVSLQPFAIVGSLGLRHPFFQHESNASISGQWSGDSTVAIVTVDGKWSPSAVVLLEFGARKVRRATDLVPRIHDLLLRKARLNPEFRHTRYLFFRDISASLEGTRLIKIDAEASTAAGNDLGLSRAWIGQLEATWDIGRANFTSQEISGEIRKGAKED